MTGQRKGTVTQKNNTDFEEECFIQGQSKSRRNAAPRVSYALVTLFSRFKQKSYRVYRKRMIKKVLPVATTKFHSQGTKSVVLPAG